PSGRRCRGRFRSHAPASRSRRSPQDARDRGCRGADSRAMIERLSAHLGYMFADEPFSMRFESAARCGFTAVEHPGPYDMPAGELRRILADNGLAFVQMALPSGDAARAEKGLACLADRQADFDVALERG